ncbi:MAG TPA: 2-amino-4-hydroxy-6-hydroxymethyldihydropteridine diphosphokinase [Polyangiaceae bacterium]|nr:2-amino-4-hydroxy-6-hydroxymethyldihydropteridine diphosphokinase [Polyangiaceae bacterium]
MDAVVGLGGNLGDVRATLAAAVRAIGRHFQVLAVSSLYETAPVGPPQPVFLNAAVRVALDAPPETLLRELLSIEAEFGRVRRERYGPRTLDLDVLWIDGVTLASPGLTVPHPRLLERRFALGPLLDVAPGARHPATSEPLSAVLERLPPGGVHEVAGPDWAESRTTAI